jgi:hypothetical protein
MGIEERWQNERAAVYNPPPRAKVHVGDLVEVQVLRQYNPTVGLASDNLYQQQRRVGKVIGLYPHFVLVQLRGGQQMCTHKVECYNESFYYEDVKLVKGVM